MQVLACYWLYGETNRSPARSNSIQLRTHKSPAHLHRFHHMKVGHVLVSKLGMLGQVDIFLGHHDPLLEEELIDSNAILLGHQHLRERHIQTLISAEDTLSPDGLHRVSIVSRISNSLM